MDHQGAGRSRPVADTRRQPSWPWPDDSGSAGPAATSPLPARAPEYSASGSGAQRILGPSAGFSDSPTPPGGFSPWHSPGQDRYLPDTTTRLDSPPLDDAGQAGQAKPPEQRRGGRTKRRGGARVAWLVMAVVVAAAGFAGYKFLYEPRVNAPVPSTLLLPTNAPGSPGFDKTLGKWQHITSRKLDTQPLTITGLYPPQFTLNDRSYVRTAASVTKNCPMAVYGADLRAALQSGHCTQVVRASYISGDGTMMGTVGVANLSTFSAAQKAGKATGPQEIIRPLSAKKGATSKLGTGTGVVQAEIKGHYLILMYAEFTNLKSPSRAAQRQALEQFAENILTGSANINLSTRMLTGRP